MKYLRSLPVLAVPFLLLSMACDDVVVEPGPGTLVVNASTTGTSLDPDGYTITVDGALTATVATNGTISFPDIAFGTHTVALTGLVMNCIVADANPRTIAVSGGQTTETTFEIACTAAGALTIATETAGDTIDTNGYAITVDRGLIYDMDVSATLIIQGLAPGEHDIELGEVAANCAIAGAATRTITISVDATTRTTYDVTCVAALLDHIAFTAERDGNQEIYIINTVGVGQVNLTNHPAPDHSPSWSPDGTKIAFASDRDGHWEIYTVGTNGSDPADQTNDSGADITPAWSPDGTKIAFATDRDGDLEIYVLTVGRPGIVKLTDESTVDLAPSWAPAK